MLLPNAKEKLKIFSGVDLLNNGSYEEAMLGCSYVLHTASPFFAATEEETLVIPAVEGTRNVLNTCNKLGVKKVILTSSTAAIYVNYGLLSEDHIYNEEDWSDETLLREKKNWYCVSKVAAEKLAWEMSKAEGSTFQLATINPTLIFGPILPGQGHLNTSSARIVEMIDGSLKELSNSCKSIVDVRDVAEAHVAALEREASVGKRFMLVGSSPHQTEIANEVRKAAPASLVKFIPTIVSSKQEPKVMAQTAPLPVLFDNSQSVHILGT